MATPGSKTSKGSKASNRARSWKMERASVHGDAARPRTNKYSKSDSTRSRKPKAGQRSRVWVGGYTRADGVEVAGHYRETSTARLTRPPHRRALRAGSRVGARC